MNKRKHPIMKMVNIRMTEKQAGALKRRAYDTNQSIAEIIRQVLERENLIPPTVEISS